MPGASSLRCSRPPSPIAEQALRQIQALYAIEADITGKPIDKRLAIRQQQSKPLLETFHEWPKAQRRRLSGKTPLGKAFQYLLRWDALTRYAATTTVGSF